MVARLPESIGSPARRELHGKSARVLRIAFLLLSVLASSWATRLLAGDTTVVVWDRQRLDSSYRVDFERLVMPDARRRYRRIVMTYTLECPRFGCDPWDRVAETFILDSAKAAPYSTDDLNPLFFDVPRYDLARIVTPYGKGWSWEIDVSHLRPLIHDSVTFGTFIEVPIGTNHHGDQIGYLVTMTMRFEDGEPDFFASGIETLWRGLFLYGIPEDPIEKYLAPVTVRPSEEFSVVRVVASGHGQGNTDNAAEFARKLHSLKAGRATFAHYLWRDDCHVTPAGEQYGSWDLARAGFCPGMAVEPWSNDVSGFYRPGSSLTVDYDVEPYVNLCRPGVEPCPCRNCEYNDYDHTKPHIVIDGRIIYYRIPSSTPAVRDAFVVEAGGAPESVVVRPRLAKPTDLTVTVLNALGTVIYRQAFRGIVDTPLTVDLGTTPGRYQLKVETPDGTFRKAIEVGA